MATKVSNEPESGGPNGWEETRNFSPKDRQLRDRGFRIHSRPKTGQAIWVKGGVEYLQSEAEAIPDVIPDAWQEYGGNVQD